jgi:hypothetical protein
MARVTHGRMQFICRYYAQVWMTILPPELVADRCNPVTLLDGDVF